MKSAIQKSLDGGLIRRVGVIPRAEKALKIQDFLSVDTTRGNDLAT